MPTLSELFNLDPNVERLSLLPRLRGSLGSDYGVSPEIQNSVMFEGKKGFMPDVIAPKILYDFIRAIKAPGRARRGEVLDEEEALNTALNMFGGGLATSGSVPIGALGMSARTAPAGTVPLREIPRSPLGFYSKVEEATLPLQNKGSGSQFLAQIQKTPGVKPEEIEVLGLDKFLQSKPTVTKQEVQDYITANKPDVQEVRLGTPEAINRSSKYATPEVLRIVSQHQGSADNAALLALDNDYAAYKEITTKFPELRNNPDWAETVLNDVTGTTGNLANLPKFSQYTIPGGENYRELLLTLPQKQPAIQPIDTSKWSVVTVQQSPVSGARQVQVKDEQGRLVGQRFGFQGSDRDAIQEVLPGRLERETDTAFQQQNFRSSHYLDQPNILTHLRANDRVIDGKKALFIEEIQSDWHQAGRKKGYGPQTETEAYYITPDGSRVSLGFGKTQEEAAAAVDPGWKNLVDIKFDTQTKKFGEGVPDAPFKKSWHELALKRAIQEAVDKGYDKLAFTTGKTQAERYDLSKQLSRVGYTDGRLQGYDKDGALVMNKPVNPDELPDYVGKELGAKMAENVKKDAETRILLRQAIKNDLPEETVNNLRSQLNSIPSEYSGLDLQVGGEGMKGFYDEILPKALQNLTKKYGTKVTKSKLDEGSEVWSMDITPQMREQVKAKGQPLFATAPPLGLASQDPLEQFLQTDEARNDPLMQFLGYK